MSDQGSNFISEWFGVRLYPVPYCTKDSISAFLKKRCPFLSNALGRETQCVKSANSSGVCTITTKKDGLRDWIVCPYRVLDIGILHDVVGRIFGDNREKIGIYPVVRLEDATSREKILRQASKETVYLFYQDKLGGEINVSGTKRTPELSFDITFVSCRADGDWLNIDKYGVFEAQTMDFHGSYKHAVSAMRSAVDLHGKDFPEVIKNKQEWLSREIEGPNIANVFKRTIYQLILKFDMAGRDRCQGVVLGLPESVWQSWEPHFGGLDWIGVSQDESRNCWIFVLTPDAEPEKSPNRMILKKEYRVGPGILTERAFTVVPQIIATESLGSVFSNILRRTKKIYPKVRGMA